MRIVQFQDGVKVRAARVRDEYTLQSIGHGASLYELAMECIDQGKRLAELVRDRIDDEIINYEAVINEKRLLPPLIHPDPWRLMVTGTGLTHLGSVEAREKMHRKLDVKGEEWVTDSKRLFKLGLSGGKPNGRAVGVQPEWFYKGTGHCLVPPEREFVTPAFALDGSEEPEVVGVYVIAPNGTPHRLGFALGNEFCDHAMERQNYLYRAHSKLRQCSFGPELLIGPFPENIEMTARIWREGESIWERRFFSGEANMSHSLSNLEFHHFKYDDHRRPGDAHVHFLGAGSVSYADGVRTEREDIFEVKSASFGRPLRNGLDHGGFEKPQIRSL